MSKYYFDETNFQIVAEVKNEKKSLDYSIVLAKFHSISLALYVLEKLNNDDFYKKQYNKISLIKIKNDSTIEMEKIEF